MEIVIFSIDSAFDLTKRLYEVFQTSSNKTFNAARLEREYGEYLISGSSAWSNPDKILNMAGNLYTKLVLKINGMAKIKTKQRFLPSRVRKQRQPSCPKSSVTTVVVTTIFVTAQILRTKDVLTLIKRK
jgi:hypothetical protein